MASKKLPDIIEGFLFFPDLSVTGPEEKCRLLTGDLTPREAVNRHDSLYIQENDGPEVKIGKSLDYSSLDYKVREINEQFEGEKYDELTTFIQFEGYQDKKQVNLFCRGSHPPYRREYLYGKMGWMPLKGTFYLQVHPGLSVKVKKREDAHEHQIKGAETFLDQWNQYLKDETRRFLLRKI